MERPTFNLLSSGQSLFWTGWCLTICLALVSCSKSKGVVPVSVPLAPSLSQTTPFDKSLLPFQTLGPGDLLEVIVRRGAGEERYTPTIQENGMVSVSFIEVPVTGITPGEAAARIQTHLADIIREPRVEVILKKKAVSTHKVVVLGEVRSPGLYPLIPDLRVLQAIVAANGSTDIARLEDVRIIRGELADPLVLSANIEQLLKEGDLTQNVSLQHNDIIYIPRTKIGNWNHFIESLRPTLEVLIGLPLNSIFQIELIKEVRED